VVLVSNNGGFYFWVAMEWLVAPAMALMVVCCSGNGIDGGGF
jgi:hypothetical protein